MAQSRNQTAKSGWGSRPNFQHSHGLKMTPDDIDEGNDILDQYCEADREMERQEQQYDVNYDSDQGSRGVDTLDEQYRNAGYDSDEQPSQHEEARYPDESDEVEYASSQDDPPESDEYDEGPPSEDDTRYDSDDGAGAGYSSDPVSDDFDDYDDYDDDDYDYDSD
ncbi:hypothetical protein AAF712_014314 [Marasmius tenuissimus]|uniref:Uncharacterized protein n=1 Tax=Marasmius tenuissimus TaxID=585030 RepID=A0ABR2ZEW5_9AGAR